MHGIPNRAIGQLLLQGRLPPGVADLGFRQAMQKRWIKTEKGSKDVKVMRQVQASFS